MKFLFLALITAFAITTLTQVPVASTLSDRKMASLKGSTACSVVLMNEKTHAPEKVFLKNDSNQDNACMQALTECKQFSMSASTSFQCMQIELAN